MTSVSRFGPLSGLLCLLAAITAGCDRQEEATKDKYRKYLAQGDAFFSAEQYDKAAAEYRNVLALAPNDPTALRQLGTIYFAQAEIPQALFFLKKSAGLEPENLDVELRLGQTYLSTHAYKEARNIALQVLIKKPGDRKALMLLADTAATPKEIEYMQPLVEQLGVRATDTAGYHLALGELALRHKDMSQAQTEFNTALATDPNSSLIHLALGNLYWSRQDLSSARKEFKIAAELAPPRSLESLRYGEFLLLTGAASDAKALAEGLIQKTADSLPPRVILMKAVCSDIKSTECLDAARDVLRRDPTNYDALYQDGMISLAKEDGPSAI